MRIVDLRDKLVTHPSLRYKSRSLAEIKFIVLHHSGTREGSPQSFARHHVFNYGWPGIGYHYVITKNGIINKTNSLTTISYHTKGLNQSGIGICLIGNFNRSIPTALQIEELKVLIGILRKYLTDTKIILHRDAPLSRTTCPGKLFPIKEALLKDEF